MSLDFNGSGAVVIGTSVPSLQNVAGATIMGWVRVDALPDPVVDDKATVMGTSIGPPPGTSNVPRIKIKIVNPAPSESDVHWRCDAAALDTDTFSIVRSGAGSAGLGLVHIAATVNYNTRVVILYKNGQAMVSAVAANMTAGNTSNTLGKDGTLGVSMDQATQFYDGAIEDMRLYSRPLGSDEIMSIYSCAGIDGIVQNIEQRYEGLDLSPGAAVTNAIRDFAVQNLLGTDVAAGCLFNSSIRPHFRRRLP